MNTDRDYYTLVRRAVHHKAPDMHTVAKKNSYSCNIVEN